MCEKTSAVGHTGDAYDAVIERVAGYAEQLGGWSSDESDFTVFKRIMEHDPRADIRITDVTVYQSNRRFREEYGL